MGFSLNTQQLAFIASKLSADQWQGMQADFAKMATDDAEPDDANAGSGAGDPGTMGNENFSASMYRDGTVSTGMAKDDMHDRVVAALAVARALTPKKRR